VAGLEALIGLRALAGGRVQLELISLERTFANRPRRIASAFSDSSCPQIDIDGVARSVGATCTIDGVVAVDPREKVITLAGGERRDYDVLVIASGAQSEDSIPGAVAFGMPDGTRRFRKLVSAAEQCALTRLAFAVPSAVGWPLSIYELALMTADRCRAAGAETEITLISPEPAPLAAFGERASDAILQELEQRGIHFIPGVQADELAWGQLRATPGRVRIQTDAAVTLPRLRGPELQGLPADEGGFIPVDPHGLVRGLNDVYAAGDAISFPIKHGSLAAQQADAVAEAIAARIGVATKPQPFTPVLRGMLLAGGEGPEDEAPAPVGSGALWWPPAKLAGRHLAPYLSGEVTAPAPAPPAARAPSGLVVGLHIDPGCDQRTTARTACGLG
jgi:sulfide:quinone oxidoreductase